jgi:hypothetical protein
VKTTTRLTDASVRISKFLGSGFTKLSIITSSLLATISFFYLFTLGSYMQPTVYIFIRRVTYINPFNDYIFSRYFDSIIISSLALIWLVLSLHSKLTRITVSAIYGSALVIAIAANLQGLMALIELSTLPLIVFFLYYQRGRRPQHKAIVRYFSLRLTLNYLVIIASITGFLSILISLWVIFISQHIPVDNYGYDVFLFFSSFSPILLIVIFFCFPAKLLIRNIFISMLEIDRKWWLQTCELSLSVGPRRKRSRKKTLVFLSLLVLFSITLAFIPHLSSLNKDNQQIGSDSESYVEWMTHMKQSKNLQDFLKSAFIDLVRGDRPLSLIFLYLLTTMIDVPVLDTVEYLPVILGPSLVLVIYYLTRELTSNETTSLFAAFLTGTGYFQVSIGIYAGLYANWIALVVGYSSLIFFFRFLRTSSKKSLMVFFVLLVTVLFSHAYTWNVIIIVMGIFLTVSFFFKSYPRKRTIVLLLVVLSSLVIDVVKTMIVASYGASGGAKLVLSVAQSYVGVKELGLVWDTLIDATQLHYGGIFCNFIVLGLVVYWLIRSNLRIHFNMYIVIFLMIGIPPLFFGDWVVQSRVFYNIPFQIPAAIALTYISRHENAFKILMPIYVWLIAMSIWTVSNFYGAPH